MSTSPTHRATGPAVSIAWVSRDRHRWAAPVAVVGATAAVAMAIFGLPPVNLHGPFHYLGVMGPLCGMTRAVRHLARLEVVTALGYNPAVVLVALGGIGAVSRWAYGRQTGRWLDIRVRWSPRVVVVIAAAAVLLAMRQQTQIDLLR